MATWITALWCGASSTQLDELHEAVQPIIDDLMGRHALYAWSLSALKAACGQQKPKSYAAFVQAWADDPDKIDIKKAQSAHTLEFLQTLQLGKPYPPRAYFKKMNIAMNTK